MLLNTSLNGGGESLVESEGDALNLFNNNKNIDVLVLNGKIYSKLAI
jgi:predicted NodU family carbamoyl transferase